ncbi:Gamma-secretase-activating protein, partial [Nibea albiflora]
VIAHEHIIQSCTQQHPYKFNPVWEFDCQTCISYFCIQHIDTQTQKRVCMVMQNNECLGCPSSKTDPQCLAALHCLLVYMGNDPNLELKVIEWLCDNVKAFESFDQIQEFILGYHTLLAVFAVRCLPHHTFLQYIDQGILQLTETFVSRLMTDLDNSDANERLKFSILKRLPEPMEKTIYHMWDHPVSSASISRDYVRTLLEKHNKNKGFAFTGRDKPGFRPEFLPLTYLAKMLSDIEEQALNPFEEQENVDARFVEETALKQTLILLGF